MDFIAEGFIQAFRMLLTMDEETTVIVVTTFKLTALSMAGILCLAPLLSGALESTLAPLWRALGLDPAMLGGILAIDMGGYQTAKSLAQDAAIGRYAGILAAATLGCTVTGFHSRFPSGAL